nr:nuclear transport factor 2 family protein [Sphingomonas sp. Y57]
MTLSEIDPAIEKLIHDVVHVGSAYDIDGMEKLYTPDQIFLVLGSDGVVTRVRRDDSIAEFRSRRDSGEEPLSTEHRVLHVEQQGDHATAILYRRMSPDAPPAMYELRLRKDSDIWRVAGETVTPWPGGVDGNFLPPRRNPA